MTATTEKTAKLQALTQKLSDVVNDGWEERNAAMTAQLEEHQRIIDSWENEPAQTSTSPSPTLAIALASAAAAGAVVGGAVVWLMLI